MSEENQLKCIVQQNMLLRVLELGYDNEFQTQVFSLLSQKYVRSQGWLSVFRMELAASRDQGLIA